MSAGTLDASRYMHGSAHDRVKFARDFVSALNKDGYAKLRNHGISHEDVREMFSWVNSTLTAIWNHSRIDFPLGLFRLTDRALTAKAIL